MQEQEAETSKEEQETETSKEEQETETSKEEQETETSKKEQETETSKEPMPDNIIYVGGKPFLNYITAVQRQFQTQNEIKVIARGKFISRAVDIAEIIRKKFMKEENIVLGDIKIDSKEFERDNNGQKRNVSVSEIEITLKKP